MEILAELTFWQTVLLATILFFAGIGAIVSFVYLIRLCIAANWFIPDTEFYEEDEYDYHGWENIDMIPIKVERKRTPIQFLEP